MGADDDADCVEHVWVLAELHLTLIHTGAAQNCSRCGAIRYGDLRDPARPPL